jgi:YD repeat-containing protein
MRNVGRWIELRDARGKLRAKWDPSGRVLEIQERGQVARWRVGADGKVEGVRGEF